MTTTDTDALTEKIRDEVAGIVIGSGYYSTAIGVDEAAEIAAAVLPIVAAEVRKAQGEAWTDCVSEASALGWLHASAALDMLDRNPHEKED